MSGGLKTPVPIHYKEVTGLCVVCEQFTNQIIFNAFLKDDINPTNDSIKLAIAKLQANTLNNIRFLKKQKKGLNQGRRLANETQLYVNSQLFLESVRTE